MLINVVPGFARWKATNSVLKRLFFTKTNTSTRAEIMDSQRKRFVGSHFLLLIWTRWYYERLQWPILNEKIEIPFSHCFPFPVAFKIITFPAMKDMKVPIPTNERHENPIPWDKRHKNPIPSDKRHENPNSQHWKWANPSSHFTLQDPL